MRARVNRRKEPRSFLFYLAVTILGLLLIGLIIMFITRVNRTFYSYTAEPNELLHMLNRGEYSEAWRQVGENRAQGITEKENKDYVLPYAVVDYFEAESYYSVFLESGNTEEAARYREAMDEAYETMGELQFMAEEIDGIFK